MILCSHAVGTCLSTSTISLIFSKSLPAVCLPACLHLLTSCLSHCSFGLLATSVSACPLSLLSLLLVPCPPACLYACFPFFSVSLFPAVPDTTTYGESTVSQLNFIVKLMFLLDIRLVTTVGGRGATCCWTRQGGVCGEDGSKVVAHVLTIVTTI